tara:strand:- start:151 stop:573 length:423 start_codon:yes stop_codon:yes gene_type:complete
MSLEIKLNDGARPPKRGSELAAGYDLYANETKIIEPSERALICTGIQMAIPAGYYGRIASRSGLASKFGIDVGAGVIDADYRSKIKILLCNNGKEPFFAKKGERIAQIILEKIIYPPLVIVEELSTTKRGVGGFGSTGLD